MKLTVDQLARIASCGGGFELDAQKYTIDQLARIASCAAPITSSKDAGRINIKNVEKLTVDQLARIASCGKGAVFFITEIE